MAETKAPEKEKKGLLGRIKAGLDDKEEQVSFISMITRLVVLGWSGFLLTLAYVDLPESILPKQDMDPTFIASIFVSTLTTFGIDANQKGGNKKKEKEAESDGITRSELKEILSNSQIIRVETAPLVIKADTPPKIDPLTGNEIDPVTGGFKK
jgi:hypothetical protein